MSIEIVTEIMPSTEMAMLVGMGAKIRHVRYEVEEQDKRQYRKDHPTYEPFKDGFLAIVTYEKEEI